MSDVTPIVTLRPDGTAADANGPGVPPHAALPDPASTAAGAPPAGPPAMMTSPAGALGTVRAAASASRADDPSDGSVPVPAGRPRDDDDAYTLPPDARPVVAEIRARPGTLVVGAALAGPRWTVRVEVPEVWDVVRLDAASATPVAEVKQAALAVLMSGTAVVDAYVVKLNGAAVLDEGAPIAAAGAVDGSIFLVTHRRRRAVR